MKATQKIKFLKFFPFIFSFLWAALAHSFYDFPASTIGEHFAEKIGKMCRPKGNELPTLNIFTHKVAHGLVGGITGAIMAEDREKGAVAGAMGAVTAEVVADGLAFIVQSSVQDLRAEGYDKQKVEAVLKDRIETSGAVAKLMAGTVALLAGQDVDIALRTGQTAIDHNFVVAIPFLVTAGMALWTAYDVYDTYVNEGVEAAVEKLIIDGVLTVTGAKGALLLKSSFLVKY